MNPYGIDPKVWQAVIADEAPTLPRVMFAAALDPLLIHDLDEIPEPQSLIDCIRLAEMGTRGDLNQYLRGVLAEWIMEQKYAETSIRPIAQWDQRLGVWLAAAAAETALRFVPKGEERPARAVQAARDWVYGLATVRDVRAAAEAAYAYADATDAADAAADAAAYRADAADAAYYAADAYATSAAEAAYAYADATDAADAAAYRATYRADAAYAAYYAADAAYATSAASAADSYDYAAYAAHAAYAYAYASSAADDASVSLRETLANAVWTYPLERS
jgi:hypothetical protein